MLADTRRQGYRCALGSVYPFDPCLRNDRLITWYIRTQVFPGAVIILHDGREDRIRWVRVLQEVLTHLAKRGFYKPSHQQAPEESGYRNVALSGQSFRWCPVTSTDCRRFRRLAAGCGSRRQHKRATRVYGQMEKIS
jgi:hypothetical protein